MRTGYWVGLFLACAITANAQSVPYSFNYQGVLRGGSGELLGTVSKTVDFRLYNQAANGTVLWGRNYAVLLDTNGLFNVELSDDGASLSGAPLVQTVKPLNQVIADHPTLYLGLTVAGAAEIAPRQQLLSVPFAMMAGDVRTASGDLSVGGTLTADKGVHVNGTISASTSLQVGSSTLTSTGTGVLSVPGLNVAGNATVTHDLNVAGNTTVSNLTATGTTTLKGAVNGPVALFSRNSALADDNWTTLTSADQPLASAVSSDGFIIINFWYDLKTDGGGDKNEIVHNINFSGGSTPRNIVQGIYYNDIDAARIAKHEVVTLPILKGESVKLHKVTWTKESDSNVKVRYMFVPFGVNQ